MVYLFGLDPKEKGRNISSIIDKGLNINASGKQIILKIGDKLKFLVNGKNISNIEEKFNSVLKTPITKGEIITLLIAMQVNENGEGILNGKKVYVKFNNDTLIIQETPFKEIKNNNENKTDEKGQKEIKLKKTDDIEYNNLKFKLGTKKDELGNDVKDMMQLLEQSVLFCSDNSIGDIGFLETEKPYYIKGESLIYDENFNKIRDEMLGGSDVVIEKKDMKHFLKEMLELAARNSYGKEEEMTEADKEDRKNFIQGYYDKLRKKGGIDFAVKVLGRKLRVNISYSNGKKMSAVMRVIESGTPPPMEALGLVGKGQGTAYRDVLGAMFGLILICGPTGSGKSMSLTAMIAEINKTQRKHIISLEDPIEFEHENIQCIIEQKEIGVDVESYAYGLKEILRQKPQIAIVGEIRDAEVMEKAIELAATGHVVFATFHSNNVVSTISRILGFFPGKEKEKAEELAEFILGIFVQKLVSRVGGGKVLIKEILVSTESLKKAIAENDAPTIEGLIKTGGNVGMITNDQSIEKLYLEGLISDKTAVNFAKDKFYIKKLVNYDEYAHRD